MEDVAALGRFSPLSGSSCWLLQEKRNGRRRYDVPVEQLVHSVRDVHVPHPVAQPMMAAPMPMSTPYMGGNVFGTQALGTTGFGTFGAGYGL